MSRRSLFAIDAIPAPPVQLARPRIVKQRCPICDGRGKVHRTHRGAYGAPVFSFGKCSACVGLGYILVEATT